MHDKKDILFQLCPRIENIHEGNNDLTLIWIPSHTWIAGNEKSDSVAQKIIKIRQHYGNNRTMQIWSIYNKKRNSHTMSSTWLRRKTNKWHTQLLNNKSTRKQILSSQNRQEDVIITRQKVSKTKLTTCQSWARIYSRTVKHTTN